MKYVITETSGPDSFDPINADSSQNLPVMRMMYATPLEIGEDNGIESSVLSKFTYDERAHRIAFVVKENLKFSDGQPLKAMDVALAIVRVAYRKPTFPVIKNIEGVKLWSDAKAGLTQFPKGILVSGNKIEIQFDRPIANPLFRFCLELFSIIPSSCVNMADGALTCPVPPSSGYFVMKERNQREILFESRSDLGAPQLKGNLESVTFQYKTLEEVCAVEIEADMVVAGSELEFLHSRCRAFISVGQLHWLPSARFQVLRFNPNAPVFSKKENRQFFAEQVRLVLAELNSDFDIQRGLFPKLLPGYLSSSELKLVSHELRHEFEGKLLRVPSAPESMIATINAVAEAAARLGMNVERAEKMPLSAITDEFIDGRMPVTVGGSGFWAQDPIGDLSMWFTKNLHRNMLFTWQDSGLYQRIDSLENEIEPATIREKMEDLNRYLVDQSIIAPTIHFRRLFITSPKVKRLTLPQAVTSPAPWHLSLVR